MQRLVERLEALGANQKQRARLLSSWLGGRTLAEGTQMRGQALSKSLLANLPELQAELDAIATIESAHDATDGSRRLLVRARDGQLLESVLLLRDGLCVSSQIGCAVGCTFCMTGRSGLVRQITSLEICAQVALARAQRPVTRVVFMGMGEPSHNLGNVLEAITYLGAHGRFAHKHLVVSSVGDERLFERLAANSVRPALSLSLHTTDAALRERLLPRAPRFEPTELIERAHAYARLVTWPFQLQWTLLEGVNDGDDELERLAAAMQGKHGIVNFIPYNEVEGLPWRRPSWDRMRAMSAFLHERGVLCKLRRSAGQDVEGACGQLRARAIDTRRSTPAKESA